MMSDAATSTETAQQRDAVPFLVQVNCEGILWHQMPTRNDVMWLSKKPMLPWYEVMWLSYYQTVLDLISAGF